jgi:hypothetical protein
MAKKVCVQIPQNHTTYPAGPFFAAGCTSRCKRRFVGWLENEHGKVPGRAISGKHGWVVYFRNVEPGTYTFKLRDEASKKFKRDVEEVTFEKKGGDSREKQLEPKGLQILYPGPLARNLCNDFTATGTSDLGTNVSATLKLEPNGPYYDGATTQQPTMSTLWMVEFDDIPNGSPYTLTVTNGTDTVPLQDLNVDDDYCP